MRKLLIALLTLCILQDVTAQTLFTYGGTPVSKQEFLRAYNKNKATVTDRSKALRDYLDLYIKFKLKVQAAKELRYDTLPGLVADLDNFKLQIQDTYLNDEDEMNRLVNEAFSRSQKDINIEYLFIPLKNNDSAKVASNAVNAYHALQGHTSLKEEREALKNQHITSEYSSGGFITVFTLPYQMENIVYSLKPGSISEPYKVKSGYYIIKNKGERPAAGRVRVMQILIAVPPGSNEDDKIQAKKTADSVYHLVRTGGAEFGDLARNASNDKSTFLNGGVMDEFGVGKYDPVFEENVFAIKKEGEIAQPFLTEYGYHIVKLVSRTPVAKERTTNALLDIKQKVIADERGNLSREKFVKQIFKLTSYKTNLSINYADLWKATDSFWLSNKALPIGSIKAGTVLFSFAKSNVRASEWLDFVKNYKSAGNYRGETNKEIFDKFINKSATDYYRRHLEEVNAEYRFQVEEFKEGNMLFEIMERNVWSKASSDSAALRAYYQENKNNYTWKKSADAVIYNCINASIATEVYQLCNEGKDKETIKAKYSEHVLADSSRMEFDQLPLSKTTAAEEGKLYMVADASNNGSYLVIKIVKIYPAASTRTFDEAHGMVVNNYQNYLEDKWVEQLKKKYPVKVNEAVLQSLLK